MIIRSCQGIGGRLASEAIWGLQSIHGFFEQHEQKALNLDVTENKS
jgi:hypothetical protein